MSRAGDLSRLLSAEVSDSADAGQLALVGGGRLADCTITSVFGLGFDSCTFQLLMSGRQPWWPVAQAEELERRWAEAPAVIRLYAEGETAWVGRAWDSELYDHREDARAGLVCKLGFTCRGPAWTELTNWLPPLDASMTDESAHASQSDLARYLITRVGGLIKPVFSRVADTATNIGPLAPGDQDLPLDLITAPSRVGNGADEESIFLVYEPEDGPILKALCGCGVHEAPRWALPITGSGARLVRKGDERANAVAAVYTDADGGSQSTRPIPDTAALVRHGNIQRTRIISVDGAGASGAEAAARAALLLKSDPRGVDGPMTIRPTHGRAYATVANPEGGEEPGWRVRAGDLARVLGAWSHDALLHDRPEGYLTFVRSTSFSFKTGELRLDFDRRRIKARPAEDQGGIQAQRRQMEPGRAFGLKQPQDYTTDQNIPFGAPTTLRQESRFTLPRRSKMTIRMDIRASYPGGKQENLYVGYALNGEAWSSSNLKRARTQRVPDDLGTEFGLSASFTATVEAGEHRVNYYASNSSAAGTMKIHAISVEVSG